MSKARKFWWMLWLALLNGFILSFFDLLPIDPIIFAIPVALPILICGGIILVLFAIATWCFVALAFEEMLVERRLRRGK